MSKIVNARFANGVFTPLEPVTFPEGTVVVLNIDDDSSMTASAHTPVDQFVPHDARFLPGMEDPQKIKQLLTDGDVEHYADSAQRGGSV